MNSILEGITVVDLTQGAAGPSSTRYLGEMGANVIKIEPPDGDWVRSFTPFANGESAHFLGHNRCKRDIVIDLKKPEGIKIVKKLIKTADVVIESFRPGIMERFGLTYEQVAAINPQIIYCSISGFGQTGPYVQLPGVDGILQGMGGLMSITGEKGQPPVKAGTLVADMTTGIFAAQSVLAALFYRERSKKGQKIEICLLDALMSLQALNWCEYLISGKAPERSGSEAPYSCPNGAYSTKDGYIMMAAYVDKRWKALCDIMGREDLIEHPDFGSNENRVKNRVELNKIISEVLRKKTSKEWLAILTKADILCGPINTYEDLVNDPQVKENQMIIDVPHPTAGDLRMVGFAPKYSVSPLTVNCPPPLLGEHTVEILQEHDYSDKAIADLIAQKVIMQRQ